MTVKPYAKTGYTFNARQIGIIQEAVYEKLVRQVDDLSLNRYEGFRQYADYFLGEIYDTLDTFRHLNSPDTFDEIDPKIKRQIDTDAASITEIGETK